MKLDIRRIKESKDKAVFYSINKNGEIKAHIVSRIIVGNSQFGPTYKRVDSIDIIGTYPCKDGFRYHIRKTEDGFLEVMEKKI